jgi:hypothetical protein
MITRFATALDTPAVADLLLKNAAEIQGRWGHNYIEHRHTAHVIGLVTQWIRHHYVRIVEHKNLIVGCIIAQMSPSLWDPETKMLETRTVYVDPEHRSSRASVILWQAWDQDIQQYLDNKKINQAVVSGQPGRTNINFRRRGWSLADQLWVRY